MPPESSARWQQAAGQKKQGLMGNFCSQALSAPAIELQLIHTNGAEFRLGVIKV